MLRLPDGTIGGGSGEAAALREMRGRRRGRADATPGETAALCQSVGVTRAVTATACE